MPSSILNVTGLFKLEFQRKSLVVQWLGDFPGGSDGKESACNAGDLGLMPGLGRSPGGRHDNQIGRAHV